MPGYSVQRDFRWKDFVSHVMRERHFGTRLFLLLNYLIVQFEYQQAQLEKEIEELSWKVERAESTERGDLETQMHVAECKRRTLLQDFFD